MAMLRSLAFVFALALTGYASQPAQPQAQVITESPCICKPQAKCEPCPAKAEEGYWSKAFKPDVLPVWIGGVSALLASIGGLVALYFIKKQVNLGLIAANTAKVAADAARDSADAYLTSERMAPKLPSVLHATKGYLPLHTYAGEGGTHRNPRCAVGRHQRVIQATLRLN
jgi:hypothetical protein